MITTPQMLELRLCSGACTKVLISVGTSVLLLTLAMYALAIVTIGAVCALLAPRVFLVFGNTGRVLIVVGYAAQIVLASLFLMLILPILLLISAASKSMDRKMIYSRKKEEEQEKRMADLVRKTDPLFSIQSFFGGVQNKLSAIHYAESPAEINAFSESDLSSLTGKYKDVVDVDIQDMKMESYGTDNMFQRAAVSAELRLLELHGGKIKERNEKVKMTLIKDAGCKTQAVCGASVLKCKGCGAPLSLMEGKTCRFCGSTLDLKKYDWVIERYGTV